MTFDNNIALADYHIHPDFSVDAVGSVEDYCRRALEKGLAEICFTTHYDSNPDGPVGERMMVVDGRRVPLSLEAVAHYVETVQTANERYYPLGLEVRCGIEVGYYPGCEKLIGELFSQFDFHYKLGAVHDIDGICVCCQNRFEPCFSRFKLEEMADRYFGIMEKAVSARLFDSIAHIDVYKKYGRQYYGDSILQVYKGRIEPVFAAMVINGVGMEINTSALRKGHSEYYPSMEILNLARKMGVRIAAIGSDAHSPDDLAFDFENAAAIAYELFPYCDE
ncbi:putative Histidinol phosphate phosphatase HisJ family [Candidatus Zixiibacteriota bacterium]|nr:putative Histidinol phosphate phosphatase HisJ family [candidate division Zixibacteria bacterium]